MRVSDGQPFTATFRL